MLKRAWLGVVNHLLKEATWARIKLAAHAGRVVRFAAPPFAADLVIDARGRFAPAKQSPSVKDSSSEAAAPDAEVKLPADWPFAPLIAVPALLAGKSAAPQLAISGEDSLAETLRFVFANLRWDYEEDLAHAVGDIAAHRLAAMLRAFAAWQRDAGERLGENLAEYLVSERRALVRADELEDFGRATAELSQDVAALEQRLETLGRTLDRALDHAPDPAHDGAR